MSIMASFKYLFAIFLVVVCHDVTGKYIFTQDDPPSPTEEALMARYVVHRSDWASVGTLSVLPAITGYPFVGLKSICDGPMANGTGVPYMLMTDMDVSMNDLNHDNKCTLFVSLAEGDYCKNKNWDPQDPRCARIMLTGSVEKLTKGSDEEVFAKKSLLDRHPEMSWWPTDHHFFIAKLNIMQVAVLDFFGGIKYVTPQEYYAASSNRNVIEISQIEVIQVNIL